MSKSTLIRGGRVIDPTQQIDEVADIFLADGRVNAIGKSAPTSADLVIDAPDCLVTPGLIDMHVHLREPGFEDKETIETGTAAAVAGGFTGVACMPNTNPPLHSDAEIEYVLRQADRYAHCHVYPIGALTKDRAGAELAEMGIMVRAGAVAFSDDGCGIANSAACARAMNYVRQFDKLFIQHCEDPALAGSGCMNAGLTATRLGLAGLPAIAESIMVQRDIALTRQTGVRYHVAHISTADAVEMVRQAKAEGLPVTTEVCPHHLLLTEDACVDYDTNTKMNPPLRTADDLQACLAGVRDGTIDCLVTDHAPHTEGEKEHTFADAPFGIIGLETAVPLFIQALIEPDVIDWVRFIDALSTQPAALLGVPGGSLKVGEPADVAIIDPNDEWTVDPARFKSKARNTPFAGWNVRGRATHTFVAGQLRFALSDSLTAHS